MPSTPSTTPFGERIVNSVFTLGLLTGLSVYDTTYGTTLGNLGWEEVRFPRPVLIGDTLRAATTRHLHAREPVAPGLGHRGVRAPRLQPARRGGGLLPPRCPHDEAAARVSTAGAAAPLRSWLFVPGDSERKQAKALAQRRRRPDPGPRGLRRSRAAAGRARARLPSCWPPAAAATAAVGAGERPGRGGARAGPRADVRARRCRRASCCPRSAAPQEIIAAAERLAALEAAHGGAAGRMRLLALVTETPAGLLALPQYPQLLGALRR